MVQGNYNSEHQVEHQHKNREQDQAEVTPLGLTVQMASRPL